MQSITHIDGKPLGLQLTEIDEACGLSLTKLRRINIDAIDSFRWIRIDGQWCVEGYDRGGRMVFESVIADWNDLAVALAR